MILTLSAWVLVAFYSKQSDIDVPDAQPGAVPAITNDKVSRETEMAKLPQPPFISHRAPQLLRERKDETVTITARTAESAKKVVQQPSPEIYRVTGRVFLRNNPAANAEIIDTIKPGTRIAVTRRITRVFLPF